MTTFKGRIGQLPLISYIDPHPGKKGGDYVSTRDCPRCGGTGFTCFVWVEGGVCFQCGGNGWRNVTVATLRRRERQTAYERDYAPELKAHDELQRWLHAEEAHQCDLWLRAEDAFKEEKRLANLVQGFIAPVGDKVAGIEVTIKVAKYIAGSYNRSSSMFVIAEDADGHAIKFFGSAASVMQLERGDRATILTGKVKSHEPYNGQDQTILSHVKVEIHIEDEEEQAA